MIECDDDFELNLSFGGGGGGEKKAPKSVKPAAGKPKEKVMLRRNNNIDSSSSSGAPRASSSSGSLGRPSLGRPAPAGVIPKSLGRTPDSSTGKINTTTGLMQHKVPVIGNKVKADVPLTHKQKQKQAAAAAKALKAPPKVSSSDVEPEKAPREREVFDDPLQYHARPKDLSKDAGGIKEVSRSEYIFTRQSFSALKMPAKVVEMLEKDVANGKDIT
jgi:hypothetical protein